MVGHAYVREETWWVQSERKHGGVREETGCCLGRGRGGSCQRVGTREGFGTPWNNLKGDLLDEEGARRGLDEEGSGLDEEGASVGIG